MFWQMLTTKKRAIVIDCFWQNHTILETSKLQMAENKFATPVLNTDEEFKAEAMKLREWFETSLKDKWTKVENANKDIELCELPQEGDVHKTKCRMHSQCSYEKMLKFNMQTSEEKLKSYDHTMIQYKTPYTVSGTEVLIADTAYTAVWPVASRQFISLHDNYDTPNGGHIFVQESIKTDKAKPNSKYVLAYKKSGLLIEPDTENKDRCYCERIIMMSPCGSIPNWVVAIYKTNDVDRLLEMDKCCMEAIKKGEI